MTTSIPFYEFSSKNEKGNRQWQPIPPFPSSSTISPMVTINPITSINLLTWNIWFDELFQETRFSAIIQHIVSIPQLDIAALQEVTPEFINLAKAHPEIQKEWIMTDYTDREHDKELDRTWYGNIFLVRRGLGRRIKGWVKMFDNSSMKRFVVILEVSQGDKSCLIRVTNGHFDSRDLIKERQRQFQICHSLLISQSLPESETITSSSTLSLLTGDLNLHSTSELEYIISHSYEDAIHITSLDPEIKSLSSASIGLTFPPKEGKSPRRSDFVLLSTPSKWKCTEYSHMGTNPITNEEDGTAISCKQGKDEYLFPSDHLAVFTKFNLN